MTDAIQQLNQDVEQYKATFGGFREMYAVQNPPPVPDNSVKRNWLVMGFLGAMLTASIVVSGSRTVEEFGGGIIGAAAFLMIEITIIAYSYYATVRFLNNERLAEVKKMARRGKWLASTVALAANVNATFVHASIHLPEFVNVSILLLVAISAPLLAIITGDVLGVEEAAFIQRKKKALADFNEQMKAWNESLNASWKSSALYKSVRVTTVEKPALSAVHSLRSPNGSVNENADAVHSLHSPNGSVNGVNAAANGVNGHGSGYTKNMNAKTVAVEWIAQNHNQYPEIWNMNTDEFHAFLLKQTGAQISRTTAHNVRKEAKESFSNADV